MVQQQWQHLPSVTTAKTLTTKQASEKLEQPEKGTQKHTTIEDVDDADKLDHITSTLLKI